MTSVCPDECTDHSQAKDFVDLHEQAEVRTLPRKTILAYESHNISDKCKSSRFARDILVYVSKGPFLRIWPDIRAAGKEHGY
jgi:hypothetical protein